jgi:hypothetical protein
MHIRAERDVVVWLGWILHEPAIGVVLQSVRIDRLVIVDAVREVQRVAYGVRIFETT